MAVDTAESTRSRPGSAGDPQGTPTILSHLLTLPSQTLIRLFSYPSNALAIFRLLPPIARHLIFTLLFLPDPPHLSTSDVTSLFTRESGSAKEEESGSSSRQKRSTRGLLASKDVLSRLGIIREQNENVYLNVKWTESLRRALIGGGDHQSFGVPSHTPAEDRLTPAQLDEFALRNWESILLYMVASEDVRTPSRQVLHLLRSAGLMQSASTMNEGRARTQSSNDRLSDLLITSKGFQFLLDDVSAQLWMLLHSYLITLSESASSEEANTTSDIVEHLTFLFTLGSATLGQDYEISSLTDSQQGMLDFFSDLGLIFRRRTSSTTFYPTRLITTLTNAGQLPLLGSSNTDGDDEKGFVILETNYKIYAYTNNPLRINILSQFVQTRARFPNLVTGIITRDSVKRALDKGISAEQIIMYLTHHAHPQMFKNNPLLPVTVTDQIRLWERETNRVQPEEGGMLSGFSSGADFTLVREYAEQMGVLMWHNVDLRKMFVSANGIQPILDFIKRRVTAER
jgi:transcription initiation factor TFIIH subunit 4